jgi:hypothetical protein
VLRSQFRQGTPCDVQLKLKNPHCRQQISTVKQVRSAREPFSGVVPSLPTIVIFIGAGRDYMARALQPITERGTKYRFNRRTLLDDIAHPRTHRAAGKPRCHCDRAGRTLTESRDRSLGQ